MIYAQITAEQQATLEAALKEATDKKWYRRLLIIKMSGEGHDVPSLAKIFSLNPSTVRTYIHTYNQGGVAGLRPGYEKGRPAIVSWSKDQWDNVLAQSPASLEKLETKKQNWTQKLLRQYLAAYHETEVSQPTVFRLLRRAGVRWRRAKRRVYSPDPLYVVKRERVEKLKALALSGELTSEAAAHPRSDEPPKPATLVFLDSTDLHWCPDIGATYAPVGQQVKVDTPGLANPWRALFGSLAFPSGEGVYTVHRRKRADDFLAHLKMLIAYDPHRFWFVALDNASAHKTPEVHAFVHEHRDRLELVFLPTYSPHLNLIERLWRVMRSCVTRNRYYKSLTAVVEAVVAWLESIPIEEFCSVMGISDSEPPFVYKPSE